MLPYTQPPATPLITLAMLHKGIEKISNSTVAGHDSISIEHFKRAHPALLIIMNKICNISLLLGTVPRDFSLEIISPIPKIKGTKLNASPEDFRGISVNPIASKIFEHCVLPFFTNVKTSDQQIWFKKELYV
jgi:hypothetical protein